MTTSGPAAMAPSSAPPVSPGVVPPELYLTHLPALKVQCLRLLPLMSGEEKMLCYVRHPDVTVCGRISPNMRDNRHPAYINDNHNITAIVQKWLMKVLDERPPYTALARKTHMGKDGSFLDKRAEKLWTDKEGYNLRPWQCSVQEHQSPYANSCLIATQSDVEMHDWLETTISEVKEDISALKTQLTEGIVKLSHNLKVSPKLQFNLKISHKLKLSLLLNPNIS
ncbi:hypothetical protein Bca52824_033122 [Brassica carinata]|uniref:Uncharacterized protein n=1 Tax=Brassica carinata TaxID=52824 RepID=A0A8X7V872_BRACI|nr:hypothetical protein Bca52824_033122 [Brassica carinata]